MIMFIFKTIIDEEEEGEGTFFICAKDACDNVSNRPT